LTFTQLFSRLALGRICVETLTDCLAAEGRKERNRRAALPFVLKGLKTVETSVR
jgi:hypothetical protein